MTTGKFQKKMLNAYTPYTRGDWQESLETARAILNIPEWRASVINDMSAVLWEDDEPEEKQPPSYRLVKLTPYSMNAALRIISENDSFILEKEVRDECEAEPFGTQKSEIIILAAALKKTFGAEKLQKILKKYIWSQDTYGPFRKEAEPLIRKYILKDNKSEYERKLYL